jgi:hypothetical protein
MPEDATSQDEQLADTGEGEPDTPKGPDTDMPAEGGVSKGAGVPPGVGGHTEESPTTPTS